MIDIFYQMLHWLISFINPVFKKLFKIKSILYINHLVPNFFLKQIQKN
jgi:hypothetical protein